MATSDIARQGDTDSVNNDEQSYRLYELRFDYPSSLKELHETHMDQNPFNQFRAWLKAAILSNEVKEPNAMTLCTVSSDGFPSGRTVLLKSFSEKDGFVFFTNDRSVKSLHLRQNPRACLVFFWQNHDTNRSVRIQGTVQRVRDELSEEYFQSRPRGSQIAAWASSNQSAIVDGNREEIEKVAAQFNSQFAAQTQIPKPDYWGGWSVMPNSIEFWQGRPDRLHDRLRYDQQPDNLSWKLCRLWP